MGYTQVGLGIILILSTIILGKVAIDNYVSQVEEFQREVCSKFYSGDVPDRELSEDIHQSASSLGNFYTVLFGTCGLIIILSLLVLFLGILNIHSGYSREVSDKAIIRGIFIALTGLVVLYVVMRLLFF